GIPMTDLAEIRSLIDRDVFDYQQLVGCLSHFRKPRDKIRRLLAGGGIVRIRKGLYAFAPPYRSGPLSRELLANLIHGPSYVSLDYALSYHGLVPERVATVTSVTCARSRSFTTPLGVFTYRSLPLPRYAVGAMLADSAAGPFLMACPEKALADKVWADKRLRGMGPSEYRDYFVEDLRIEHASLESLNASRLKTIADAYGSRKVLAFVRFVLSLKEPGHA
ncbi:MAG: hypothetical protein U1E05_22135, partial [Patescibacteria group bacterium]|nr:hypothetical protein [Patescibacteria group bacterium]